MAANPPPGTAHPQDLTIARSGAAQPRDWNVPASGAGCVTRFEVDREFASRYPVQNGGEFDTGELWVPAEELDEFNRHSIGLIEVVDEFGPQV